MFTPFPIGDDHLVGVVLDDDLRQQCCSSSTSLQLLEETLSSCVDRFDDDLACDRLLFHQTAESSFHGQRLVQMSSARRTLGDQHGDALEAVASSYELSAHLEPACDEETEVLLDAACHSVTTGTGFGSVQPVLSRCTFIRNSSSLTCSLNASWANEVAGGSKISRTRRYI
jgi:hypothetical protein